MAAAITPGAVFSGATSGATVGAGGQTAIARWITPQRQDVTTTLKVGVQLFHINGEDKVAFVCNGGSAVEATARTKETDNIGEWPVFWGEIDATDFSDDDEIEIRAICYPASDGEARVLQDSDGADDGDKSLWLWANSGATGAMFGVTAYVDAVGGNDATGDGTSGTPYQTVAGALQKIADANSGKFAGCTLLAKAGSYKLKKPATATDSVKKWVTLKPAPGVAKADVLIVGRDTGTDINGIWLKVQGCTFDLNQGGESPVYSDSAATYLWVDDCDKDGNGDETTGAAPLLVPGTILGARYYTNITDSGSSDGLSALLVRHCTRDATCSNDSYSSLASGTCVIDCVDSATQYRLEHADTMQLYNGAGSITNVIVDGLRSVNRDYDGLSFSAASNFEDIAIVNSQWDTGAQNSYLLCNNATHIVIRNNTFTNFRIEAPVTSATAVVIEHCWMKLCYSVSSNEATIEENYTFRKNHFADNTSFGHIEPGTDVTIGSTVGAQFPNNATGDFIPYDTIQKYAKAMLHDAGGNARASSSAVGAYASKEEYTATPPYAPTSLVASALSVSAIRLTWDDVNGNETGYEVEYSTNGTDFTLSDTTAADAETHDITGLLPATSYYVRARATNASGDGPNPTAVEETTMAFPIGWLYRAAITVDNAKVGAGGVTDFSVLLTEANLPAAIFTNALSDGGDIRITTDSAGTTECAVDVIKFDTGTSTAIIRTKVPSLSADADTTFYIWYGNASATLPAASDTYGAYAAYDANWIEYLPLEEGVAGGANSCKNRIADARHGTPTGTVAATATAKVGAGVEQDGNNEYINVANAAAIQTLPAFTWSCWAKMPTFTNGRYAISKGASFLSTYTAGLVRISVDCATTDATATSSNIGTLLQAFTMLTGTYEDSGKVASLYLNGSANNNAQVTGVGDRSSDSAVSLKLGDSQFANAHWPGQLDEWQVHNTDRSAAWILTEYNQTNSPGTFASAGEPVSQVPTAPSDAAFTSSGLVATITWTDNSDNETGFQVEYNKDSAGWSNDWPGAEDGTVAADGESFVTPTLAAGTYQFRVRALGAAGNSAYSTTASATLTAGGGDQESADRVAFTQRAIFRGFISGA